jgi:hypothetical protein
MGTKELPGLTGETISSEGEDWTRPTLTQLAPHTDTYAPHATFMKQLYGQIG